MIPGNDDAIRSANLMCRIIGDAIIEGHWLRQRKQANRPGAKAEAEAAKPAPPAPKVLSPEEQAAKAAQQQAARDQAAAKQRELEARLLAAKDEPEQAAAPETAAPEAAPETAPETPANTETQESDTNG